MPGRGRGKKKKGRSQSQQDDDAQPTQGSSRKGHEQKDSAVRKEKVVVLSTTPPAGLTLPDQKKVQATKLDMKLEEKKVPSTTPPAGETLPDQGETLPDQATKLDHTKLELERVPSTKPPAGETLPDQGETLPDQATKLEDMKLELERISCEATEFGVDKQLIPLFVYSQLKKEQTRLLEKSLEKVKFEQKLQEEKEQHKFELEMQRLKTSFHQNQCLLKYQFAALGQRYLLECFFTDAEPLLVKQGEKKKDMTSMTKVCKAVRHHWPFVGRKFCIEGPFPHINGTLLYGSLSDRLHIPYRGTIYVSNEEDTDVKSFFKQLAEHYNFQEGFETIDESAAHAAENSPSSL